MADTVLFSQSDFLAGRCTKSEIDTPSEPRYSFKDHRDGRCEESQIGKPAPRVTAINVNEIIPANESPGDKVIRLAMQALDDLGGVEFFKANPDVMKKVLTKIAPSEQMRPRFSGVDVTGRVWPEWLTARRLLYQESMELADDIELKDPAHPRLTRDPDPDDPLQ